MVLVRLDRVWGSQSTKTLAELYRPTKAALEVLEFSIMRNSQLLSELPNVGTGASTTLVSQMGDPVPEGSYMVDHSASMDPNEPFSAEWLPRDIEADGTVADFLTTRSLGLERFEFNGSYFFQPGRMVVGAGYLWLTPIRHLAEHCPNEEADRDRDKMRAKFSESVAYRSGFWGNRSGFWGNRVIPLGVLGHGGTHQPDNRMADGVRCEDWLTYDCNIRELLTAAV
jgi:hypothetical protein